MYSLHGLLARIGPSLGQVCHSLIVVSYCTPGSAQDHAAVATFSHRSRAFRRLCTLPSVRRMSFQSPSERAASMKAFVRRTELLLFWPLTVL